MAFAQLILFALIPPILLNIMVSNCARLIEKIEKFLQCGRLGWLDVEIGPCHSWGTLRISYKIDPLYPRKNLPNYDSAACASLLAYTIQHTDVNGAMLYSKAMQKATNFAIN